MLNRHLFTIENMICMYTRTCNELGVGFDVGPHEERLADALRQVETLVRQRALVIHAEERLLSVQPPCSRIAHIRSTLAWELTIWVR